MLSKLSVKKPMTIVVAVIAVIVLGIVSFGNMTTDLLPSMDLPYVIVMTTYPGASPEKVELAVTRPLEQTLATTSGMDNMTSISNENVSMVILEFNQSVNMDSVMIEMSGNIDLVKAQLEDGVGAPVMMRLNPDMLPVMMASVDSDTMDLAALSKYVNNDVIPAFERIDGVASVTASGLLEKQVRITLDQTKIDALNRKVLASVDQELADAEQKLIDAQKKIDDGYRDLKDGRIKLKDSKAELEDGADTLDETRTETYTQLAAATLQLDQAQAQLQAILAEQQILSAQQQAFESEKQLLQGVQMSAGLDGAMQLIPGLAGKTVADLTDPEYTVLQQAVPALAEIPLTQLQSLYAMQAAYPPAYIEQRTAEIEAEQNNLNTRLMTAQTMATALQSEIATLEEAYKAAEAGKYTAIGEFTKGEITLESAKSALEATEKQLDSVEEQLDASKDQMKDGWEQFEKARDQAYKAADLGGILTKSMISNILMAENFNMPAGTLTEDGQSYTVKVGEKYDSVEALRDTLLFHMDADGVGDIRLADVASVQMTDNAGESYAKINGNDGIILSFQKQSTASTAEVADAIHAAAERMQTEADGFHFTALMDQGIYIDMVISSVLENLLYGGALAILILILFLKDIKPTLIVGVSIPISVMFAIVLMYFSHVTLNIISLSGLALGVGMLVDNSIVVIENIYRLRSEGYSAAQAAVAGAKQVAGAISASTLTTVCVFLPIVFAQGISKQLFTDMGLTIAYSLVASLLVALTLVPAMASKVLHKTKEIKHPWYDRFVALYERSLRFTLRHKVLVLLLTTALLAVCVVRVFSMGTSFIPEMDSTQMSLNMTMPKDSTRAEIIAMTDTLLERLTAIEDVDTVGAMEGGSGLMSLGGGADMSFYILLDEGKTRSNAAIAKEMTEATADLDCEISISTSNMDLSALGGSGMQVEIAGKEIDTLRQIAQDVAEILEETEGTAEINNGLGTPALERRITVDKERAMRYGYTVAQIYAEVASAIQTEQTATTLTVGSDDYPVILVSDPDTVVTVDTLGGISFTGTLDGEETDFLLSDVAEIVTEQGMSSIRRSNQARYVTVSAVIDADHNIGLVSRDVQKQLDDYALPDGYTVRIAGENETINDALHDLLEMILLAVILIYLIMVAQFQSLLSPFIVMFTIPLAFTGGLLALWITGKDLSIISMLGFLILSGVVVNNGIVFVDYTNQLRIAGSSKREALVETGCTRMRPILMTALTTILAMSTMAFGLGAGGDMAQPMALVAIGGLLYATVLTLYVVPVLYDIFYRKAPKVVVIEEGEDDDTVR